MSRVDSFLPSPRRLAGWLLAVAASMCVVSLACQFVIHVLERDDLEAWLIKFDVDAEANLPTWFSSALLLMAAGGFAACGAHRITADRRGWCLLAFGFVAMSIDETAQIHEELGFLQSVLHTHGLLYFAWEIPAIIVVCLAGVILIPFLMSLPRRMRTDMVLAGVVYLAGALGVEAIGGWHAEVAGFNNFTHSLIATAEEGLEMCGVIMLIVAQVRVLHQTLWPSSFVLRRSVTSVVSRESRNRSGELPVSAT